MADNDNGTCHICYLPTEMLLCIFTYLSATQLIKCRQVCFRWKNIVDDLTTSDIVWQEYCKNEYSDIYKTARQKSRPGLLWYNIYKSLALWPKLNYARQTIDEFASASSVEEEILNFSILKDGIIGVLKRKAIVYYDIETLEQSSRATINGVYVYYLENDDVIAALDWSSQLYITCKSQNPQLNKNVTFANVKFYILVDKEIYYANFENEIYVFRFEADMNVYKLLTRMEEYITFLGYTKNRLTILTSENNIYTLTGHDVTFDTCIKYDCNAFQRYREYNLGQGNLLFPYHHQCQNAEPIIHYYGDVVFVGHQNGILHIYHLPNSLGLDFINKKPIKTCNFMKGKCRPDTCPIIQIDVLEAVNGHTVLVAMSKKVVVLNLVHRIK